MNGSSCSCTFEFSIHSLLDGKGPHPPNFSISFFLLNTINTCFKHQKYQTMSPHHNLTVSNNLVYIHPQPLNIPSISLLLKSQNLFRIFPIDFVLKKMSYSKQYIADRKKSGKAPEKKNFTQACNILNQYIKEKGSLRDLNITEKLDSIGNNLPSFNYVTGTPEISQSTTVDFLSNMENPSPAPAVRISSPPEKSLPPLPQFIDVESFLAGQATSSKPISVEAQTAAAMTIFYGGQVMVFNDFSEEKVGEIMLLASKSTTGGDRFDRGKAPLTSPSISASIFGSQEQRHQAINVEANGSDLPIARRASLHKFLAKRKDRAAARAAPYEVTTSSRKDELMFDLNF